MRVDSHAADGINSESRLVSTGCGGAMHSMRGMGVIMMPMITLAMIFFGAVSHHGLLKYLDKWWQLT
jgi:hypothetical protein